METIDPQNFEHLVLLLTTALGLAFLVERVLKAVNSLMKRLTRSEHAAAVVRAPLSQASVDDLETKAIRAGLEEQAETLEAMRAQLENGELTGAQREDVVRQADATRAAALNAVRRWADLTAQRLEAPALPPAQKTQLEQQLEALHEQVRAGTLDTRGLEVEEHLPETTVFLDPATPKEADYTVRVLWLQLIGVFAGVTICAASGFGLFEPLGLLRAALRPADYLLTGVLIGAGSQPIHFLIRFLTDRKVTELRTDTKEEVWAAEAAAPKASTPAAPPEPAAAPSALIGMSYEGGVDRALLESRHRRRANPDLIVYHHTAMHSDSTFEDVVRVIKDQGWSTGYNCVVTKDGAAHSFCRWDRYGNHAKGYNSRSLGVALNGNFETDPSVPFANVNGRLGIERPTDAQLLSAARVVALWCHLYDIPPDFEETVIPHKKIAPKACPGSGFPYAAFEQLVKNLHAQWEASPAAQQELLLFKQKAFLYV